MNDLTKQIFNTLYIPYRRKRKKIEEGLERIKPLSIEFITKPSMFLDDGLLEQIQQDASYGPYISLYRDRERDIYSINNALTRLIQDKRTEIIEYLDLTEFSGIFAANNNDYGCLADFGNQLDLPENYTGRESLLICFKTKEDFQKNLVWYEFPLIDRVIPAFYREYDNRYFIVNSGGGHHIAALHRQCREQGITLELPCEMTYRIVWQQAANYIFDWGHLYLLHSKTIEEIQKILREVGIILDRPMRSWKPMYEPKWDLVGIEKGTWFAETLNDFLSSKDNVFNLNQHLRECLDAQSD